MDEVYRFVYFGGVSHPLRPKVWPVLLRGSVLNAEEKTAMKNQYETKLSEWRALELVINQRDQEILIENLAKQGVKAPTQPESSNISIAQMSNDKGVRTNL